jgi:hypothetical protein
MPLVPATLETEIADDLKEFQDYATGSGTYLERQLTAAGKWFYSDPFPWDFKLGQGVITGISGTLGPYSLAAITDFDVLALERRISKYYAYDAHDVQAPIADGSYGRRYEITLDRSSGTPVVNFFSDPGNGDRVFTYLKKFTFAGMATWPDDEEIKDLLRTYTAYMCTRNTEAWLNASSQYLAQAKELLKALKLKKRAGMIRQDSRDPQDVWGQSLYQQFSGDSIGFNNGDYP